MPATAPARPKPVMLLILDGWGHREEVEDNALAQADLPNWRHLLATRPHTLVHTGAFWLLTSITVVYCLWAIFGSAGNIVQYAFLFVLFITVFYPFFSEERRRQRGQLPALDAAVRTTLS